MGSSQLDQFINLCLWGSWVRNLLPGMEAVYRLLRLKLARFSRELAQPRGGPAARARRRVVLLSSVLVLIVSIAAMPDRIAQVATATCRLTPFQPALSDACAMLGVRGIPTAAERVAWQKIPAGSCEALEAFAAAFPKGANRQLALERLSRQRQVREDIPTSTEHRINGYVRQSVEAHATQQQAIAAARGMVEKDSRDACGAFADSLRNVQVLSVIPRCSRVDGGYVCGADYAAGCFVAEYRVAPRCD